MKAERYLIEQIFSMNPTEDIYKAFGFCKTLFGKDITRFSSEFEQLTDLEKDIHLKIPLKICYELYFTYKDYNLNHVIIHKDKSGKLIKIPLYDLRDAMRRSYFKIIDIIYNSSLMGEDFGIGESGNLSYRGDESDG